MILSSLLAGNALNLTNCFTYFFMKPAALHSYVAVPSHFWCHLASCFVSSSNLSHLVTPLWLSPALAFRILAILQAHMAATIISVQRTHKTTSFDPIWLQICNSNCSQNIFNTSHSCVHNHKFFSQSSCTCATLSQTASSSSCHDNVGLRAGE